MKKIMAIAATILAAAVLFTSCGAKAPNDWTSDYNAALEQAKKNGSNILLYISGHDSEGVCDKLTAEIMSQKSFLNEAKGYIAVQLDVVTDEWADEEEQNAILEIGSRLGLQYYPSILLMTADEKIFADIYFDPESSTLESMTADLKSAVETGKTIAKLEKDAAKATGAKKAQILDTILKTIPETYLNGYIDYAQQIVELDPENTTGVVGTYKMLFAYQDAIAYLFSGDYATAVAIYDDLAADPVLTADDKQQCYLFAASLWYYMQDWENCFVYLQKSIDASPDSENAQRISEQLAMLQMQYEMSLAAEGEVE